MLVITVTRKPLEGTVARNAMKWGTGGLNIDGTRIAHGTDVDMGAVQRQGAQSEVYLGGAKPGDVIAMYKPGGRWPANLILSHLPNCEYVGLDKIKPSNGSGRTSPNGRGFRTSYVGGETKNPDLGQAGFVGEDGKETVESWACQPGCPVAALDEQSGIVPTGTWNRQTDTAHPFGDAKNTPYETWQESPKEAPAGASRYFKVVGG